MNGAGRRRKGASGEREALKALGEELGVVLLRNLEQTREAGGDCVQILGYVCEVKRCERLCIPAWWRQAVRQAEAKSLEPILMVRQSRKPWRVFMNASSGPYREMTVIEAAVVVREKWARLYGEYANAA